MVCDWIDKDAFEEPTLIMPFFKTKPPIRKEEYEWLVACFAWLRTVLDDANIRPELVTPDHPKLVAAKTGPELFEAVRELCGMQQWPCLLEMVAADNLQMSHPTETLYSNDPLGTFSVQGDEVVIQYSGAMLRNPEALAATFAHELCHYLLANAGDPPGGAELMEHSTDCAAAYLGFGVLLANSARQFEQFNDGEWHGWRSSTAGYLSEQSLVTATALFVALHNHEAATAAAALKPYLKSDFKKACKVVRHDYPDLAASLSEVDLAEWSFA